MARCERWPAREANALSSAVLRPGRPSLTTVRQADGTSRLAALPSGQTLGAWNAAMTTYAPASARTAWARAWTTPLRLFLADLASGEALPGAHVPLTASGELQMAGQAYSPDPSTLRAASGSGLFAYRLRHSADDVR